MPLAKSEVFQLGYRFGRAETSLCCVHIVRVQVGSESGPRADFVEAGSGQVPPGVPNGIVRSPPGVLDGPVLSFPCPARLRLLAMKIFACFEACSPARVRLAILDEDLCLLRGVQPRATSPRDPR
eukprot:tig00021179_g19258.t1